MSKLLILVTGFSLLAFGAEVEISVRFDPEKHEIFGSQWITFSEPQEEAWFVVLANLGREPNPYVSPLIQDSIYVSGFDPAWTRIERAVWEKTGEDLPFELLPAPATYQTYSLSDVLLRVFLPSEAGKLRLDFRTRFPHVWVEPGRLGDIYTWRFGWHPILLPEKPSEAFPLVLPFHEYTVELELPEGWQAFLPGEQKREGNVFKTSFAQAVNSVALFFGPKERFRTFQLESGGRLLEGVALPGDEAALRALLTWIPEILSWYEERFGPYPEKRILLVEHPTPVVVAMTAEGIVFLPRWFFSRENLTAAGTLTRLGIYILAHELAHFWWGIGAGVDFDAENWLSEGLCQYLSITWYEERFGAEGGNLFVFERKGLGEELVDYALGFVNLREHLTELPYLQLFFYGFDEALVKPTREVKYDQATADRLYNKGYLVLRALAHVLGEENFHRGLRAVMEKYRGKTLSVSEFRKTLEEETGQDLSEFFADWVLGEAWADYGIRGFSQRRTETGYWVELSLTYRGTGILPVPVLLSGPEEKKETFTWTPSGAPEEKLEVALSFPVQEVILDPEHRIPDVDRLNNRWPRRYVLALKNDLPLDGYLVTMGSAGAFALTYLDRFGFAVYPQELSAEAFVNFGRVGSLSGWVQIQETLVGALTFTQNLWATPKTGSTATYWEWVGNLSFTLARIPEWAFALGISWSEVIARARAGSASFLFVPEFGYGIQFNHTELFGLGPNFYLTPTLSLGYAAPNLPQRFWPSLSELRTQALSLTGAPIGQYKAAGILGVWLPPYYPDYSLGNAALVSKVRPRLFLSGGQVWDDPRERRTYLEVGGELWITVEALGGLWAANFVVGLAYPLLPAGPTLLYFGLGR